MLFSRRLPPSKRERTRLALWPRRSWGRSYAYYKHRVLRLEASPHAIAAGFAAGAFASCTPLLGLHILIALALAALMGGSLLAAAIGTVIGNPLTFPFIWVTSFEIGSFILGKEGAPSPLIVQFSFETLTQSFELIWPTLKPMLVGGALLGLVVGGASYVIVRSAVTVRQRLRTDRLAAASTRQTAQHGDEVSP